MCPTSVTYCTESTPCKDDSCAQLSQCIPQWEHS